ncbi:MAG: hypothetical protein OXJ64_03075 [Boseongicola sp.]|nr:hypothetical protein [Boseongicola sp.]
MELPSGVRILGYCDDWRASPGGTVEFKVSCDDPGKFSARIGRVVCADQDPLGPGYRIDHVEDVDAGPFECRHQPIHPGSFAEVDDPSSFDGLARFTVAVLVHPTLPGGGRQVILSHRDDASGDGWSLEVSAAGEVAVRIGSEQQVSSGQKVIRRHWYAVAATVDLDRRRVSVVQHALREIPGMAGRVAASADLRNNGSDAVFGGRFMIAAEAVASGGRAQAFFNGKIERPSVFSGGVSAEEAISYLRGGVVPEGGRVLASWDFSRQIVTERIEDVSGNNLGGRTVNMPTRAMTGHNWNASTLDWRHAKEQYGAIHFHADDVYDCDWDTDFAWTVPDDAASGYYAALIETDDGASDYIPFFVRPKAGKSTSRVAVIAPTATYLAYANTHVKFDTVGSEVMGEAVTQVGQYDMHLHEHRELGHSTYDHHSDGSGVCYSSRLRPMLTMRPGPYTFNYVNDTHLLAWLDHIGQDYDIVTDEDIHEGGAAAIGDYSVIMTLSHPEYTSTRMWDALDAYQRNGGRHMYLGGNGFYWRVGFHEDYPGILECRKDATGVRAWEGEPGEGHMLFTGEPGGLWRTDGRAPQSLVGIGYSSTMFARSTYYRRSASSYEPRFGFMFEGMDDDEVIGDFGRRGGGAAGLEIDRWDPDLGSPPNSVVLASSENVGIDGILSCEEYPIATRGTDGLQHGFVRADMVFFETPNGGAVFSVGSITWVTSLSHDEFANNVSLVTGNVLARFLDDRPFDTA